MLAPAQAAPTTTSTDKTACQRVYDALPTALQDDLAAALSLDGVEQHRALVAIRYATLHGAYGAKTEAWATAAKHRRAEVWATFPARLRADVRAARKLPYVEQHRAMEAITYAALRGVYGHRVQRYAEKRQAFYAGCPGAGDNWAGGLSDPLA